MLSDHKDASFGSSYGTLIKELRILSRAIFVVGPDDKLKYVEYVPEVSQHPDYEAALAAAKKLTVFPCFGGSSEARRPADPFRACS